MAKLRYTVKRSRRRTGYWAVYDGDKETLYSYGGPFGRIDAKAKQLTLNANEKKANGKKE